MNTVVAAAAAGNHRGTPQSGVNMCVVGKSIPTHLKWHKDELREVALCSLVIRCLALSIVLKPRLPFFLSLGTTPRQLQLV